MPTESSGTTLHSGDGQMLAVGGADGTIRLWGASTGEKAAEWSGAQGEVRSLAFQAKTGLLATAGGDVRLWQIAGTRLLVHIDQPENPVRDLNFSSDGRYVLSADEDQAVRRFDLEELSQALRDVGLGW